MEDGLVQVVKGCSRREDGGRKGTSAAGRGEWAPFGQLEKVELADWGAPFDLTRAHGV